MEDASITRRIHCVCISLLLATISGCGAEGADGDASGTTRADDSGSDGTTTGATSPSETSGTTTGPSLDDSTSTSGAGSSDSSSSTGEGSETGASDCTQVAVVQLEKLLSTAYWFGAPDLLGDPATDDSVIFQFVTADVGMFDLAQPPNDDLSTCHQCISATEDEGARSYFQIAGKMQVLDDPTDNDVAVMISGVRLVEVTYDGKTGETTPVPDGACIDLVDGMIASPEGPEVPREWTCEPAFYAGDDGCDCGCGVVDPDCDPPEIDSCEYCDEPGSCSTDECPGTIDPADIGTCS